MDQMRVYTAGNDLPQWNGGYTTLATFPPSACGVDVHVFLCKRATLCQCGSTSRAQPQPPICNSCGQAHW